jgi:hypothetical protein
VWTGSSRPAFLCSKLQSDTDTTVIYCLCRWLCSCRMTFEIWTWVAQARWQYGEVWVVGSEVLTAMVMKRSIFWDITLCSPLKVGWHFKGMWRWHVSPKHRLTCNGLRSVISRKIKLLTVWAVLPSRFFFFSGVGLTSPGTAATSGLLYSPRW